MRLSGTVLAGCGTDGAGAGFFLIEPLLKALRGMKDPRSQRIKRAIEALAARTKTCC